jgi:hypothetical protein
MGHHPQRERAADLSAFVEQAAAGTRGPMGRGHLRLVPPVAPQPADPYAQLGEAA